MIRTVHDGIPVVEGIENPYRDFIVGIQFHPENDIIEGVLQRKDPSGLCDRDTCLRFFQALVKPLPNHFPERFEPPVSAGGFFGRGRRRFGNNGRSVYNKKDNA